MTDQIFLNRLCLPARIGVFEHEKQAPQDIWLDITLDIDTRPAAMSDALTDTLDYQTLTDQLAAVCLAHHRDLVETLAEELAAICLSDSRVQAVSLTLGKPHAIPQAQSVGVRIHRQR